MKVHCFITRFASTIIPDDTKSSPDEFVGATITVTAQIIVIGAAKEMALHH